jgi:hypothetical protein
VLDIGSYLTGRIQRVEDYLSESIQCHSGVPQLEHLGPIFFILDINRALDLFENVSVLGYADDHKLFMTIQCIGDCQLFQKDLDRLGEWCHSTKFDPNADIWKSISFRLNMRPIEFVYLIDVKALERVDEIKDLGVIMDSRMIFSPHIKAITCVASAVIKVVGLLILILSRVGLPPPASLNQCFSVEALTAHNFTI